MSTSRFVESKIEGQVQFQTSIGTSLDSPSPVMVGETHDAVIHLIEFKAGTGQSFWFGTAEIACSLEGIAKDAEEAGLPSDPRGYAYDPFKFDMVIWLNDGRKGLAKVRTSRGHHEPNLEIQEADFVGLSDLK
jgi:hypothetical protein